MLFSSGFIDVKSAAEILGLDREALRRDYGIFLKEAAQSGLASVPAAVRQFNESALSDAWEARLRSSHAKLEGRALPFLVPYEVLAADPRRALTRSEIEKTARLMVSVFNEGDRLVILWPKGAWKSVKPLVSEIRNIAAGKINVRAQAREGLSRNRLDRCVSGYSVPGVLIQLGEDEEIPATERLSIVKFDMRALKGYDLMNVIALVRRISDENLKERERLYREVAQFDIVRSGTGGLVATAGERFTLFIDVLYQGMLAREATQKAA